jgi:hypothetical protein
MWPLATQLIENAVSVRGGGRLVLCTLRRILQDTLRAAVHSGVRSTPLYIPPFPDGMSSVSVNGMNPWRITATHTHWPLHSFILYCQYDTYILTPANLCFLEPYALHSAPRASKLLGTILRKFLDVQFHFGKYVFMCFYVCVETSIKCKYLNDTNI